MKCPEKGVLEGSEYFFFTPTELYNRFYYYILVCGHFFCDSNYKISRKSHLGPLILFMVSGELHVEYEGNHYLARKNDLLLINCDRPHAYYSSTNCEFYFLHINGNNILSLTDELIKRNNSVIFSLQNYHEIRDIMEPLIAKMYFVNNIRESEASLSVYRILCAIQSTHDIIPTPQNSVNVIINDVICYMRAHPEMNFTIEFLAQLAHLSPYYFAHKFKEYTGLAPLSFMYELKISVAKTMLSYTRHSINDIATSLGYSSSSSFINSFRSKTGMSPSAYRKENS